MGEEQDGRESVGAAAEAVRTGMPAEQLEALFRAHHSLVFRAAYRVTGNLSDSEDILQTVFLRLLRREAGAPALESAESYLRRAAVNAALDLMRSRHVAASVPIDDISAGLSANSALSPDRQVSSAESMEWLRRAIARLSPRAAEILALRFFEDMDNAEIARLLDTTPGTVAVTLHRTRDRLLEEFRSYVGGTSRRAVPPHRTAPEEE